MCGIDLAQAVQAKVSNKPSSDPSLIMFPPPTEAVDEGAGASGVVPTGATPRGPDPRNRHQSLAAFDRPDIGRDAAPTGASATAGVTFHNQTRRAGSSDKSAE